ncbi:MAG TPA: hypothetical protein VF997_23850, partial [Polyangia bacterium]
MAAWSPALPDPRLPATMPTPIAQRVAEFVARLVGTQSARDVAPPAPASASTAMATTPTTMPAVAAAAAPRARSAERTFVVIAPPAVPSWRPGAAAARVEQLGLRIDAHAMLAWGEPTTTTTAAIGGAAASTPPTASTQPASARPVVERTVVAPTEAPARATGAARLSQFVERLVGVQAARATAPLPLQALVAAVEREAATSAATASAAPATAAATVVSGRAPARVTLAATSSARPSADEPPRARSVAAAPPLAATAPGAIGRRAEQLGGSVGVRAASLSIDFVDPARLSLLTGTAPSMPTVAASAPATSDTIMPAARPLFATQAASVAPSLTAEEWSIVATFPSAATAVQLAAARQARQWTAPERTLLSAVSAGDAEARARSGAPAELVAPTMAPTDTPARLPGGRTPRGSFTWPQLADYAPSRAEWTAPVAVTFAEQAKQAAPGTPLWGALLQLSVVSPSLAASAAASDGAASAAARDGAASASAAPRELVRGEPAAPTSAGASTAWPGAPTTAVPTAQAT